MNPLSIHFKVREWTSYSIPLVNPKTNSQLDSRPLWANETAPESEGLAFIWSLEIVSDGKRAFYYESEEFYIIRDKKISNNELTHLILQSYRRTKDEVSRRNAAAGLNFTFPAFEEHKVHKQLSAIRLELERKR